MYKDSNNYTVIGILLLSIVQVIFFNSGKAQSAISQDSLENYAFAILDTIRTRSYYSKKTDWMAVTDSLRVKLDEGITKSDIIKFFQSILAEMGEYHGGINYQGKSYGMPPDNPEFRPGLSTGFKYGAIFRYEILDSIYGYLFIPPIQTKDQNDRDSIAMNLQNKICELFHNGVKYWIIDLRINLGGDMYAMLGGLAPLLHNGVLGKFIDYDEKEITWSNVNGNIYEGNKRRTNLDITCSIDNPKIAVLTSPITSSSGEVTALSFKNHENAVLVGEPTSGYTTATQRHYIDSETNLILAGALICDFYGEYHYKIIPDYEFIGGDNFINFKEDLKIQSAKKILSDRFSN